MDSEGQVSSATIQIAVDPFSVAGAAIYEPFDYTAGGLSGKGGSSGIGLSGTWAASTSAQVVAAALPYGTLPALGGSIGNLNGGSNNYGGTRAVSTAALAGKGLLNDGATLWFSLVMGYGSGANMTNARLAFALANSNFSTGNYQYYIANEGTQLGSGLGVTLGRFNSVNGKLVATQFRDASFGTSGWAGNVFGTEPGATLTTAPSQRLVVGKITWGASSDTIEIYQPASSMNPGLVTSTLTVNVNQSAYDVITWCRGDVVTMDEIRFGGSYQSVIGTMLVPNVVGQTQSTAQANIVSGILVVGSVTSQHDATVPAGKVISQNPAAGTNAVQGSGVNLVVSLGPLALPDYQTWVGIHSPADLDDPTADLDGDGLNNGDERIWGLDPTRASSINPISVPLNAATGTFSYTRRDPALTGQAYTVWTSNNLQNWTVDAGAVQTPGTPDLNGIQTVAVTLSQDRLSSPKLYVRMRAEK